MKKTLRLSALVLALLFVFTLVACAPKDVKAARTKLEKADYTVATDATVVPTALKLLGVKGVETVLVATKTVKNGDEETLETVTAIFFTEKDQVNEYYSSVEEYAKKNGKDAEIKKAGKWIYYGTSKAMKDFA